MAVITPAMFASSVRAASHWDRLVMEGSFLRPQCRHADQPYKSDFRGRTLTRLGLRPIHPLPEGERNKRRTQNHSSPPRGEGARRADEGDAATRSQMAAR